MECLYHYSFIIHECMNIMHLHIIIYPPANKCRDNRNYAGRSQHSVTKFGSSTSNEYSSSAGSSTVNNKLIHIVITIVLIRIAILNRLTSLE